MKDIIHAVIFGFKEILHWEVMKFALISGVIVTAIWTFFGFIFWEQIVSIGSHILELVPFSMVRSNGAWMLSTFLWLQAVLLTFALLFAFFGNLILRSVSKEKYTYFSTMVAVSSAIFWAIVWFFKGSYIYHQFLQLLTWLPFQTIEKSIGYLIGFYLIYSAIVVSMVFVVSMFSKPLIKGVEHRHFPEDKVVTEHTFKSIGYTIKDSAIFTIVSLLAFPLLFVPIVNIIFLIISWIWLIKDTFRYDIASLLFKEVDKEKIKEHNIAIWTISFITVLFNFVPILNLFGPFFGEISMFHYIKSKHTHSS